MAKNAGNVNQNLNLALYMDIDIQTLIFITGIIHLIQVFVFYIQYRANKNIAGPGWWLMWSVAETLGLLLILLRGVPVFLPFVILFQDIILLAGAIFIYIGILRFFDQKINLKFILSFFGSFVILHLFFYIVDDNIAVRSFLLHLFVAIIAFLTTFILAGNRTRSNSPATTFSAVIFFVHGGIFAYLSVMILLGVSLNDMFARNIYNYLHYFDPLLAALLWTFSFVIMLNQKLNEEISEVKIHFEQIFNANPDAAVITRLKDGLFADCNECYTRMSGYSKDDIWGKTIYDLNTWKNQEDRAAAIKILQEKGFLENHEFSFLRKNGEVVIGLMSAKIITIKGTPHVLHVIRDISDRKRMENALRESEEKFRELFEANTDGITIFFLTPEGPTSGILDMNENAARMVGYTKEEMLLMRPDDFEKKFTVEMIEKRKHDLLTDGHSNFETTIFHKDGHEINVEIKVSIVNYFGQPALMNIVRDITGRKKAEEDIKLKTEQLVRINAEKDKLFSVISHDLRGPFSGFLGLTQIMVEDLPNLTMSEINEIAVSLRSSAINLFRLLENLLQWSRMQQGLILFNPSIIPLAAITDESITMVLESAKKKEIVILNNIPEDLQVFADIHFLQTIIRNLVSNAVKFTPHGGKIILSAKAVDDKNVEISVEDTGIGMCRTMVDRLFRLDFQTGRIGTDGELSTGLGLLLCKEFVERYGGTIYVESEENRGSTFYFTLPVS